MLAATSSSKSNTIPLNFRPAGRLTAVRSGGDAERDGTSEIHSKA
jgi:hypothetical protein